MKALEPLEDGNVVTPCLHMKALIGLRLNFRFGEGSHHLSQCLRVDETVLSSCGP